MHNRDCLVSHPSEQTSGKGISTPLRGNHHAHLREIMRAPLRPLTWSHGDARASAL